MPKQVQIIQQASIPHTTMINVAAYCRVSTAHDQQEQSLTAQITYYKNHIDANPEWINAGVYHDTGSGRSTKSRPGYQKMMARCKKGKIDLILTKSVSRFGRDYSNMLHDFDELRERGIDIWFDAGGIKLLDSGSRVLLELYAVFAQAESELKSEIIRWGLQKSFQSGEGKKSNLSCYGYLQDVDGNLVPDAYQSAVVRFIFEACSDGFSLQRICRLLEWMGIRSPTGKIAWARESVREILTNEKYMGVVLHQKTYIDAGTRKRNRGNEHQYLINGHHEGIVSQELFERVACALEARRRNR